MAKSKWIMLRVNEETKSAIGDAARQRNMAVTTFMLDAARRAIEAGVSRKGLEVHPKTKSRKGAPGSGACPAFFQALCYEARRGAGHGYDWAGYELARHVRQLIAWDNSGELRGKLRKLATLVRSYDDEGMLEWLEEELPQCMQLVPERRHQRFLKGFYQMVEENDGVLLP